MSSVINGARQVSGTVQGIALGDFGPGVVMHRGLAKKYITSIQAHTKRLAGSGQIQSESASKTIFPTLVGVSLAGQKKNGHVAIQVSGIATIQSKKKAAKRKRSQAADGGVTLSLITHALGEECPAEQTLMLHPRMPNPSKLFQLFCLHSNGRNWPNNVTNIRTDVLVQYTADLEYVPLDVYYIDSDAIRADFASSKWKLKVRHTKNVIDEVNVSIKDRFDTCMVLGANHVGYRLATCAAGTFKDDSKNNAYVTIGIDNRADSHTTTRGVMGLFPASSSSQKAQIRTKFLLDENLTADTKKLLHVSFIESGLQPVDQGLLPESATAVKTYRLSSNTKYLERVGNVKSTSAALNFVGLSPTNQRIYTFEADIETLMIDSEGLMEESTPQLVSDGLALHPKHHTDYTPDDIYNGDTPSHVPVFKANSATKIKKRGGGQATLWTRPIPPNTQLLSMRLVSKQIVAVTGPGEDTKFFINDSVDRYGATTHANKWNLQRDAPTESVSVDTAGRLAFTELYRIGGELNDKHILNHVDTL